MCPATSPPSSTVAPSPLVKNKKSWEVLLLGTHVQCAPLGSVLDVPLLTFLTLLRKTSSNLKTFLWDSSSGRLACHPRLLRSIKETHHYQGKFHRPLTNFSLVCFITFIYWMKAIYINNLSDLVPLKTWSTDTDNLVRIKSLHSMLNVFILYILMSFSILVQYS